MVSFDLTGKIAIVTGASKGIGESIAKLLAQAGAQVVVSSRKQESVDEVAREIIRAGGKAVGVAAHVGDMAQLKTLFERTMDTYGGVDIVVNNAAANPVFGPVQDCDTAAFDKIMDVNVKAPFELGKLVHPVMKQRGGGSVINISSVEGLHPSPGLGIYSVSKSAMLMLTKVMAKEWGGDNIRVNAICPGLIKTKFSQALWENEKMLRHFMQMTPLARMGTTDEIAGLALFLASDFSSYCTGAVFTADGGTTV
ncbi:MAG: glucose 1-dehydrogenase [Cytophagales bacterium]|jgi:NAD(P)-dependent dehydrogenase (short-subunit alcohol dehydrogenase family)|nr:glucose 1-dehydrogenase [Cytophagales bacterium]